MAEKKLRPPPRDARCDAYFPGGEDRLGHPVVTRCRNTATVSRRGFPAENWLCESCAKAFDDLQSKTQDQPQ